MSSSSPIAVMSGTGTTTERSHVFSAGGAMIATLVAGEPATPPPSGTPGLRKRATSAWGWTVADRPMR